MFGVGLGRAWETGRAPWLPCGLAPPWNVRGWAGWRPLFSVGSVMQTSCSMWFKDRAALCNE